MLPHHTECRGHPVPWGDALSVPGIPADSLPDIFLISPLRADFIRWQPGAAGAPLCPAFLAVSLPRCHRPHDHLCTLGSPLNLGDGPDALPHARRSWRHGDPPPIPLGRAAMATASAAMVSAVIAISGHCPIRPASVIWARYPGLEHRPLPGAATLQHLAVRCDDVTHPRRGGVYDGAAGLDRADPGHRELLRPLAGLAVHVHRVSGLHGPQDWRLRSPRPGTRWPARRASSGVNRTAPRAPVSSPWAARHPVTVTRLP